MPGLIDRVLNLAATSYALHEKNDVSLEQWHRQNRYDSPAEQMKRLRAAGLNPDLIYDKQSAGQGITYPESDIVNGSNIEQSFHNRQMEQLQKESVQSQINLNDSAADLNNARAGEAREHENYYKRQIEAQNILDGLRLSNTELNRQHIAESLATIDRITHEIGQLDANTDWIRSRQFHQDLENAHFDEKFAMDMGLMRARTSSEYADAAEARASAAKMKEEIKQLEEITKTLADKLQYQMRILSNDAEISDNEKKRVQMEMYEVAFNELKYKGYVYQDSEGYHFTDRGAKVAAGNSVIDFVGKLFGAVGNFYTHHSFTNATNAGKVQETQVIKNGNTTSTYSRFRDPKK